MRKRKHRPLPDPPPPASWPSPPSRRTVLRSLGGAAALALGGVACSPEGGSASAGPSATQRRLGAEWESHARTFMAWPASKAIWGRYLPEVRRDIAGLARAIAAYEPVVLLARPGQEDAARRACGSAVEIASIAVDDLWTRDTLPVFVADGERVRGVDFNFNGWGGKQARRFDARVARRALAEYGIPRDRTWVVAEGGSFETDGRGTLMVTKSSLVNANRNPGKSRRQIEDALKEVLGVRKVIWFAGVRGEDITDAHVDSMARFAAPGVVLLDKAFPGSPADSWSRANEQAKSVLKDTTDARGKPVEVIELPQPDPYEITGRGDAFLSSYVNFYVANGAVFVPRFGDAKADDRARQILRDHFPGRDIVPVKIDAIASGGGGIHCATHDQPGKPAG
ncbi:agmatine deiminase family protein [Streptomyces halobius]|uniref:Agmatine deiminase family protein n=1 Tax=Streptomyces halobius TaxID=2879846 RepID=A0ABY4M8N0_9ACTN|nr:agmatine deiminase family protein [Streptomyces halobius]UQA94149.1 agmatine deiminase family protein [Streptomyces halobius]